ncbi:hypothetical protein [Luoshenia tenuis]|jgi:hypothetical protein|uniref:hypothetical protein n=1 Tax=Luoshenia tenuis TaxID=2763654 RepID=UPI003D8C2B96
MLLDVAGRERTLLAKALQEALPDCKPFLTPGPLGLRGYSCAYGLQQAGAQSEQAQGFAQEIVRRMALPQGWQCSAQNGYLNFEVSAGRLTQLTQEAYAAWPEAPDRPVPLEDPCFWPVCRARRLKRLAQAAMGKSGENEPDCLWHALQLPQALARGKGQAWLQRMMRLTEPLAQTTLVDAAGGGQDPITFALAAKALALAIAQEKDGGKEK